MNICHGSRTIHAQGNPLLACLIGLSQTALSKDSSLVDEMMEYELWLLGAQHSALPPRPVCRRARA